MARLALRTAPLAILEPPFGRVELVEAAYWHPSRTDDPAVRWLLKTLQQAARGL
jgi:DNA-binding transcriptional LysR family regulator